MDSSEDETFLQRVSAVLAASPGPTQRDNEDQFSFARRWSELNEIVGPTPAALSMSGTCATHALDKGKSESCLVKAPATHASESVLVVSELLCAGVQATHRETHTRKETREMCSCWGYKQRSSSRKSGEWRDSNFQQSSRLANLGS